MMPILLYAGAGAALLYLAGRSAEQVGGAADSASGFTKSLVVLLGVGAAVIYLPKLIK